jgi:sugar/nucleoside kinase (ribokinase family)
MRLLVLGHLSLDVFHPAEGGEVEEPGGLFRAVAALSSLCGRNDRVIPVSGVGTKEHAQWIDRFEALPGVETEGIFRQSVPVHKVHYYFRDRQEFVECAKELAPPIPFQRIKQHLDVDGILINMISGVDIALETLDEIRMAVRSEGVPIHLDYHNLTTGVNDRFERVRKPLVEWRRWAFMLETVQCNEEEIAGLTLEGLPELSIAGHMMTLGVKGVLVTRGPNGVALYTNQHKSVVREDVPVPGHAKAEATIGLGDIFGAAFWFHYRKSHDLQGSVAEGVQTVAALAGKLAH